MIPYRDTGYAQTGSTEGPQSVRTMPIQGVYILGMVETAWVIFSNPCGIFSLISVIVWDMGECSARQP